MKVAVAKESQSSETDKGQQALLSSLDMSTDKPKTIMRKTFEFMALQRSCSL